MSPAFDIKTASSLSHAFPLVRLGSKSDLDFVVSIPSVGLTLT